ncbi:hypothetical protein HaLaN_32826 [Haematococcus lacustris]|uniref:Uncharacterized protein n=1 Tax=Haematococcus lacustris TaxID=44745 RepID=A0A6A0AMH1_HAELA|nr:hypothetical protein HaLaN_32826 [Haematococcus lacustris]
MDAWVTQYRSWYKGATSCYQRSPQDVDGKCDEGRPSLLPILWQRIKQPYGTLSQATPSDEVGQLMKAAGSSSPNNKEASEPMLAERVAGGRLPGTEPLSPLGKAALEEVRLLDAWFACCYISLHDTPRWAAKVYSGHEGALGMGQDLVCAQQSSREVASCGSGAGGDGDAC